jgi:hypothetical protein
MKNVFRALFPLFIAFFLAAMAFDAAAQSSSGPNLPTAATGNTNTNGGGTRAWINPGGVEVTTGTGAQVSFTVNLQISDDLIATGFGFSIPGGSIINGIMLTVDEEDVTGNGDIFERNVQLTKNGSAAVGNNKAVGGFGTIGSFATSTFGSSSDLWGTTWTPSDINASTFGVVFITRCAGFVGPTDTGAVRGFRLTVFFTNPAANFMIFFNR